jgi:hypothetical protein
MEEKNRGRKEVRIDAIDRNRDRKMEMETGT